MIDLTPLDVRKKSGDFPKTLRGYDPAAVDDFLGLVAERLEGLVKSNMLLGERVERLQEQVSSQEGRERAVQEALVTAQELRQELGSQAQREAKLMLEEAESKARRTLGEAETRAKRMLDEAETQTERLVETADRKVEERRAALDELERKRLRFLRSFRGLLERELDVVEVEEGRKPLEQIEVELDLGAAPLAETAVTEPVIDVAEVEEDPEGREVLYAGDEVAPPIEDEAVTDIADDLDVEVAEVEEVEEIEEVEVVEDGEEGEEGQDPPDATESTGPAGLAETEVVGDVDIRDLSPDDVASSAAAGEVEGDADEGADEGAEEESEEEEAEEDGRPPMEDEAEEWLSSILEHAEEGERGKE